MYGENYHGESVRFFDLILRSPNVHAVLVQNDVSASLPAVGRAVCIYGSNRLREFSAWQEGINLVRQLHGLADTDCLVLTNDTFFRSSKLRELVLNRGFYGAELPKLVDGMALAPLEAALAGTAAFGHRFRELAATFFLAIRYRDLVKAGGIIGDIEFDQFLSADFSGKLFIDRESKAFSRFYNQWLGASMRDGVGYWPHSACRPYCAENFEFLREKAKMCLLEANLTARLAQSGISFANLYPVGFLRFNAKLLWNGLKNVVW